MPPNLPSVRTWGRFHNRWSRHRPLYDPAEKPGTVTTFCLTLLPCSAFHLHIVGSLTSKFPSVMISLNFQHGWSFAQIRYIIIITAIIIMIIIIIIIGIELCMYGLIAVPAVSSGHSLWLKGGTSNTQPSLYLFHTVMFRTGLICRWSTPCSRVTCRRKLGWLHGNFENCG